MHDTISALEPSELVTASSYLMELWTAGFLTPAEVERRAAGAHRLKERLSSHPWHAAKREDRPGILEHALRQSNQHLDAPLQRTFYDADAGRSAGAVNDMSGFARDSRLLNLPEADRTSALTTLRGLNKRLEAGKLTDSEFRLGAQQLLARLEVKREGKLDRQADKERVRGDLYVRERLLRAVRLGEIDKQTADFAQWLLDKKPRDRRRPRYQRAYAGIDQSGTAGHVQQRRAYRHPI
ncbi:MAG: hypothetical protein WDN30_14160 [Pararobbsia sp.]